MDEDVLIFLQRDIELNLGMKVEILQRLDIPQETYDGVRGQFYSTKILKEVIKGLPHDTIKVLGVIDKDIYIPVLTFVFGEAQLGGAGAIVSLARLRQEFYGLRPSRELFYERIHKESLHELGHTFGLVHCDALGCVMYFSNTVVDVDRKGNGFCQKCYSILKEALRKGGEFHEKS